MSRIKFQTGQFTKVTIMLKKMISTKGHLCYSLPCQRVLGNRNELSIIILDLSGLLCYHPFLLKTKTNLAYLFLLEI